MIDMRGDGQVQYDGFEYSRSFRSKHWGPSPGVLSNRGLVRRRRWLRLMMRPAHSHHEVNSLNAPAALPSMMLPELEHHEEGATRPPSVVLTMSDSSDGAEVWRGDTDDWGRCYAALRRLGRDGRKLELWAGWLDESEDALPSRPVSWDPTVAPYIKVLPPHEMDTNTQVAAAPSMEDLASANALDSDAEKLAKDSGASLAPAPKGAVAAVVRAHVSRYQRLYACYSGMVLNSVCSGR